jgi:hypothetical protein
MSPDDLPDDEFLATFERAGFGPHEFHHRDHLRMAHLYVQRFGLAAATERACAGIRALAAAHGHADKYHATLSQAWVRVVALAMQHTPQGTFDELLAAHPRLLDKNLLLSHYSRTVLFGPRARDHWVAPDRRPIPAVAA